MLQSSNIQIVSDVNLKNSIVLGNESEINFTLSNVSTDQKAYNVTVEIILSDGLDLLSSTPAYNQSTTGASERFIIQNFKDFAPLESDYKITYNLVSSLVYKNGTNVPFNTAISGNLSVTWDSMPRGNYDAGNQQYYNVYSFSITTTKLSVIKTLPAMQLKGAGDSILAPSQLFQCVVEIQNNKKEANTISISDYLPNGFRYLNGFTVTHATTNTLLPPTLIQDEQTNIQTLYWDHFTLLANERVVFQYECAIYDRYGLNGVANSGDIIPHKTNLSSEIIVETADLAMISYQYQIAAMDVILSITQNRSIVDCNDQISFGLAVFSNQYHDLSAIAMRVLIPDGQAVFDASDGTVQPPDSESRIPIEFDLGGIEKNSSISRNIKSVVEVRYRADNGLVSCGDQFILSGTVTANNVDTLDVVTDDSSASQRVILPTITKTILGKYYRNLQPKTIPALAPLDYVEYELVYDSTGIEAAQQNIILDDFFPLDTILPIESDIESISGPVVAPEPIDPHGLRWTLGTVDTETIWTIRVKSELDETVASPYPINLFKLTGENHQGLSYSERTSVSYATGTPNIVTTREIQGINFRKVESGQSYTTIITFTNQQNDSQTATDAFHFSIQAVLSEDIITDMSSMIIAGTAGWQDPVINGNEVSIFIDHLKVNEYIRFTYEATLPDNIPPSYRSLVASQIEIPYCQTFDVLLDNVRYDMAATKTNFVLKSRELDIVKSYDSDVKQLGSNIDYEITVTVPKGTAIYRAVLTDYLPTEQVYNGNPTINNEPVTIQQIGNGIEFPEQSYLYSADADVVLVYGFTAKIISVNTNLVEVSQLNVCDFDYEDKDANPLSDNTLKSVIVSNPKLNLTMSSNNNNLYSSTSSLIAVDIYNLGDAAAANVTVDVAIPDEIEYVSSSSTVNTPTYDAANRILSISVPYIGPHTSVTMTYIVKGTSQLEVGDTVALQALSHAYTNTIDETTEFPAVGSNSFALMAHPAVLLTIYPPYRTQSGNGYVQVTANSIASVPYTLVNQGGGNDSFELSISPSKYQYDITIGDTVMQSVPENTAFSGTFDALSNVASGSMAKFKLVFTVPDVQIYDRNPYTVTVSSLYDDSVSQTNHTEMIDP